MNTEIKKELPQKYKEVLSLIGYGKSNATKVQYIGKYTGLKDVDVRTIVRDLIVTHKYKIGTSNNMTRPGYYVISNKQEQEDTIQNLLGRCAEINKRIAALQQN